jgi:hypothetical protein
MKNGVSILGSGTSGDIFGQGTVETGATRINWDGTADQPVFSFSGVKNAELGKLTVYLANKNNAVGVLLYESNENKVHDITVMFGGSNSTAFYLLSEGDTYGTLFNNFNLCKALGVTTFIKFNGVSKTYSVADNHFQSCYAQAVSCGLDFVKYSDHNFFYDIHIRLNTADANGTIFNSATPTSDTGVYFNTFYGYFIESNVGYTAIRQNYNSGDSNKFIAPLFEPPTTGVVTSVTYAGTVHQLTIVSDSSSVNWNVWGGLSQLNTASLITQSHFEAYIAPSTSISAGLNTFTFLNSNLNNGKGIVLVYGMATYDSSPSKILEFYGIDNSISVANQGIIYVSSNSSFTTDSTIQFYVVIEQNTG